jgi:hypothetical protein
MDGLISSIILFIIMTIFYTILGSIIKRTIGVDVAYWITIFSIVIPVVAITIWVFTTPNDITHMVDNVTNIVNWFFYMLLGVLFPLIVGEGISSVVRRMYGEE